MPELCRWLLPACRSTKRQTSLSRSRLAKWMPARQLILSQLMPLRITNYISRWLKEDETGASQLTPLMATWMLVILTTVNWNVGLHHHMPVDVGMRAGRREMSLGDTGAQFGRNPEARG